MKPRHVILASCLAIAAWLAIFGDKASDSGVVAPVMRASAAAAAKQGAVKNNTAAPAAKEQREVTILALRSRDNVDEEIKPSTTGDALFGSHNWTPAPLPPVRPLPVPPPPPPPPPTAPPLPFTYLGKKAEDGQWEVYLARGEQTFIVREKGTVENMYRVDSINPPNMSLTYLPLNQTQNLQIGGAD